MLLIQGSLPHRQLRNYPISSCNFKSRSLPHRQLRNRRSNFPDGL